MERYHVLLLCGGQSEEHEVSLASARSVLAAAGGRFDLTPLVIDRQGRLLGPEHSRSALADGAPPADGLAAETPRTLARLEPNGFDVVFPLLHGPHGEDGSLQGMLELMGLPFVGSGVLGSAVGMDKLMMKAVFAAHGFPQVRYRGVSRHAWRHDPAAVVARLDDLAYPRFVKPANLGSSVGISRVEREAELAPALEAALALDRRAIVEEGAMGARELEVAVLGNDTPDVSPVGEIAFEASFYDYRTKYTEGEAELIIPAEVPTAVAERCRRLAREAFLAIDAAGLARVDFFYLDDGRVLLNEINTIPGFTATSMYPKLWAAAGVDYPALVERLLELALERR